jgi:hypothetical protein
MYDIGADKRAQDGVTAASRNLAIALDRGAPACGSVAA